jgi:hypothetical protein
VCVRASQNHAVQRAWHVKVGAKLGIPGYFGYPIGTNGTRADPFEILSSFRH